MESGESPEAEERETQPPEATEPQQEVRTVVCSLYLFCNHVMISKLRSTIFWNIVVF